VLRGGSAWNEARNLRSANRNRNEPEKRNDEIGFRVVRDARPNTLFDDTVQNLPGRFRPHSDSRLFW
jgi:hypothetical protein